MNHMTCGETYDEYLSPTQFYIKPRFELKQPRKRIKVIKKVVFKIQVNK